MVLSHNSDNSNNFGIWLSESYENNQAATDAFNYTYSIQETAEVQNPSNSSPDQIEAASSDTYQQEAVASYDFPEMTNVDTASCSYVHDRLKLDLIEPSLFVGKGVQFADPYFQPENVILWQDARGEFGDL